LGDNQRIEKAERDESHLNLKDGIQREMARFGGKENGTGEHLREQRSDREPSRWSHYCSWWNRDERTEEARIHNRDRPSEYHK
jgi:hypothetical protein